MGPRSPSPWLVAACAALGLVSLLPARSGALGDPPAPGAWIRPVDGPVTRPFVAPRSRYGAGHRGVDLGARAGTPVRAANAGTVSFAGDVAGSLHVVVAHANGLRTSYSFLASTAVRRGQDVARGQAVGTAGGGGADHAGVLHFGLRSGDRYVDPMALFTSADLTRVIRLAPVDVPPQHGLDPPALERRTLAEALHLPRGLSHRAVEAGGGLLDPIDAALGEAAGLAELLSAPLRSSVERLGAVAAWLWHRSALAPVVSDARAIAARLLAWARSRLDCVDDPRPAGGSRGSGRLAMAVAGIDSSTDRSTGATMRLDTEHLGYHDGDVRYFSYASTGGAYGAESTWGDLSSSAVALRDQLRATQRMHPGREVDLIGHSQGGVVIAAFLAHVYDPGDPTLPPLGTVVTLSSPLRGAPAATAVGKVRSTTSGRQVLDEVDRRARGAVPPTSGTSTAQLAEDSPTIRRLTTVGIPDQIDLTSIGGVDDVVVPADHTTGLGARSVTVNPSGLSDHSTIVEDPAALDATRLALEGRPLPCIGVADGVRAAVEPVVIGRVEHTAGDVGRRAGQVTDALVEQGGTR